MPLPAGLPTSTLTFGPYPDVAGGEALVGLKGTIRPVDPQTRRPVRLVHVATGAVVIPEPVEITIGEDTTAQVGPLPRQGTGQLSPDNFLLEVKWRPAASYFPSPEEKTVALPADSAAVVDFDRLGIAQVEPAVYVPVQVGPRGEPGLSAFEIAVAQGFVGTETDWIASLEGDAATVVVESTTTGAAGSSAEVVNVGTPAAAQLEFTIPRGDKGDRGDAGDLTAVNENSPWSGNRDLTSVTVPSTVIRTVAGNSTVTNLPASPGATRAGTVTLVIRQAASGGPFTLTWPATLEWAGDAIAPAMPTVPNAELIVHLFWTGIAWRAMVGGTFFP